VAANYGGWHLIQTKTSIPGFRLPYPLVPE
jgi:hypothetical protein